MYNMKATIFGENEMESGTNKPQHRHTAAAAAATAAMHVQFDNTHTYKPNASNNKNLGALDV